MREWLASRAPREQLVLGIGAVAAALIVLWGAALRPLTNATARLEASVAGKRDLVTDLQRAAAVAPADPATPSAGASQSLVVLIDRTAQTSGVAATFTATRPDGQNAINVSFQNAEFDAVVEWLLMLERDYGVSVRSASFSNTRERGLVSGQLLLGRG